MARGLRPRRDRAAAGARRRRAASVASVDGVALARLPRRDPHRAGLRPVRARPAAPDAGRDRDADARRAADRRDARHASCSPSGPARSPSSARVLVLAGLVALAAPRRGGAARAALADRRRRARMSQPAVTPLDRVLGRRRARRRAARADPRRRPARRACGCPSRSSARPTSSRATPRARRCARSRPRGSSSSSRTAARASRALGAEEVEGLYELRTALEVEAARLALERHDGRLPGDGARRRPRAERGVRRAGGRRGARSSTPTRRSTPRSSRASGSPRIAAAHAALAGESAAVPRAAAARVDARADGRRPRAAGRRARGARPRRAARAPARVGRRRARRSCGPAGPHDRRPRSSTSRSRAGARRPPGSRRCSSGCSSSAPATRCSSPSLLGNSPWTVFAAGRGGADAAVDRRGDDRDELRRCCCCGSRSASGPGLGTILNAVVVGLAIDVTLVAAARRARRSRSAAAMVLGGIALVGIGSGLYLSTVLGPGPRDGLMTGLHRRTGRPVALVRTAIEITALVVGVLLGGHVRDRDDRVRAAHRPGGRARPPRGRRALRGGALKFVAQVAESVPSTAGADRQGGNIAATCAASVLRAWGLFSNQHDLARRAGLGAGSSV